MVSSLRYLKRNIFQSLTDFFEHKALAAGQNFFLGMVKMASTYPHICVFLDELLSDRMKCQNVLERCKHVDIRFTIIGPQHVYTLASMIQNGSFIFFAGWN